MQRWSFRLTQTLRTFLRRGALFVLAIVAVLALTASPLVSRPANAADIGSLSSLTSFTNGLSSCAIETVGWVICPTMRSIAKLADYGFTYINQNFMQIDYNIQANDSGTFKAWDIMKNIANALFVIAFMTLIYSQLTGRGSGGYNIKRLIPRLIIAAIAVNVSYYLCVVVIDISNILGNSILSILNGIADRVGTQLMPIGVDPNPDVNGTLTQITSSVLGRTTSAWVFLAPLAAVTISVATISAATLILLIMRKAIIATLILAAPILFVAYLLPNLERFFYQGSRLFVQLLILYPIMALLLGAGQIVSATIVSVGANDTNYSVAGDGYATLSGTGSAVTDMVAAAVAVLPLLGVWFLFKNMSSIMSTAGSRLSASIKSRRGSDDKDARVTGKAAIGAANTKNANALERLGRRQAFSRNRRHASLGGSALDDEGSSTRPGTASKAAGNGINKNLAGNALDAASRANEVTGEDMAKQLEELQNARINGQADGIDVDSALANAVEENGKQDGEKHVSAKDMFNDLNKAHESKDKDRKFSAGPAPAGGSSEQAGSPQPTAPTPSYRAPSMAQSGNIITGGSSASTGSTRIVAVPVQIDPSSLLGKSNPQQAPDSISQPPVSGTEEKAKARAQKYLYEADQDIERARDATDILGHKEIPTEQPHTSVSHEDKDHKDSN